MFHVVVSRNMTSQGVSRRTKFPTELTIIAGWRSMLSFDMLKEDRSCLGAVAAFSTTPLDSVSHISLDHLTLNLSWYKSTFKKVRREQSRTKLIWETLVMIRILLIVFNMFWLDVSSDIRGVLAVIKTVTALPPARHLHHPRLNFRGEQIIWDDKRRWEMTIELMYNWNYIIYLLKQK